ncbi:MAG: DJ-1/PfpI family protein [Magnetococcales bacterium]|nr:DJ-1/PfpI family protein [Magnetococcales bacterium]MBF0149302.1 DJ-1/PfpI family protein [Magnetococcales bacterium]MBF0172313.1 DJ-1/PfpI family protein [Magnetococcales bacterium]MBF0349026.1 DJ-1/PfpI family protein [Magnetococcales bacterium]MBF0630670.1 DJ-1/PfpI family protein [Magnetococcales bacterium]
MSKVLVPLAEGFEELEAVTIIDILRRAEIEVVVAGLKEGPVRGSRRTVIIPDTTLDQVMDTAFDMIALPGGLPGSTNLNADPRIHRLLDRLSREGRMTAAICAAPLVLASAGLLKGRKGTSFPGALSGKLLEGVDYQETAVVVDGTVITSRGPGTALDFALKLVELLAGGEVRQKVELPLQRK